MRFRRGRRRHRLQGFSRYRSRWKKKPHTVFRCARWPSLRVRRIGARMQIIVKAKYKGPIVSRYCAVAGKIKVAGPWVLRAVATPKNVTYIGSTCVYRRPRSLGWPGLSRTALDVSLIFINDSEFEFLHRWYGNRAFHGDRSSGIPSAGYARRGHVRKSRGAYVTVALGAALKGEASFSSSIIIIRFRTSLIRFAATGEDSRDFPIFARETAADIGAHIYIRPTCAMFVVRGSCYLFYSFSSFFFFFRKLLFKRSFQID